MLATGNIGWPFPIIKYKYIFQIKHTEATLSNSSRKLLWFVITKMLIAVLTNKFIVLFIVMLFAFSALTLLVMRQEGPVRIEWWGAGVVICLDRGAYLHTAQLMPLPLAVCCFSKIQISFTFLVLAHPGSPGQRAVKRVCVHGRLNQWAHWARAQGPRIFFLFEGPATGCGEIIFLN